MSNRTVSGNEFAPATFSRMFLVLLGVLIPLCIVELGFRFQQYFRMDISLWENPRSKWDGSLGWLGREHYLGNRNASIDVLIVGDSFTEGLNVKSENMWFASLAKESGLENLVAYGGLGYGSLQELIVLRSYLEKSRSPKLIVLQLCSNDIINNYFPLESKSFRQRPPAPRPYLEDQKVVMHFPRAYGDVLAPIISWSRFAYHYSNKWDIRTAQLVAAGSIESIESEIGRRGFGMLEFREAIRVTDKLLGQIKNFANGIPIAAMLVDDIEPYTTALRDSLKRWDIPLFIPVRERSLKTEERHEDGAHLNERGNEIVGSLLVNQMHRSGILPIR